MGQKGLLSDSQPLPIRRLSGRERIGSGWTPDGLRMGSQFQRGRKRGSSERDGNGISERLAKVSVVTDRVVRSRQEPLAQPQLGERVTECVTNLARVIRECHRERAPCVALVGFAEFLQRLQLEIDQGVHGIDDQRDQPVTSFQRSLRQTYFFTNLPPQQMWLLLPRQVIGTDLMPFAPFLVSSFTRNE